jgi:acyl-CoA hydrolase
MISDAVLHLAQSGALSEESPIMTCVAVGGADFYGRLSGLPGLAFAEVAHTHAAQTLAGLASFHAVNSAVEVDLFGRVNAESIDGRRVSGPGGLPDFAHAASQNSDGLSIIALPATDGSGTVSRIVPRFHADTPITVPGQDVDAVVTEFGAAMLRGQPPEERARRLCEVAHPDHRAKLREAARIPPESP